MTAVDDTAPELSEPSPYDVASLFEGLDAIDVLPEIRATLSHHVRDREAGVFGRKEHSVGGSLGIKDATITRGECQLKVPVLNLARGAMCVLVGPNGSGKSTFFDALMERGSVDVDLNDGRGTMVVGSSTKPQRRKSGLTRIARLEQEEILTAVENLPAYVAIRHALRHFLLQFPVDDERWADTRGYDANIASQAAQQRIIEITSATYSLFKMQECAGVPVKNLSGGERTKLSLILLLMSDADVVLFDEPTNHLDLVGIANLLGIFEQYKRDGVSMINISHVHWFLKLAGTSRTLQIEDGCLRSFKSPFAKIGKHIFTSRTRIEKIEWCKDARPPSGLLLEGLRDVTIPNSPLIDVSFASLVSNEIRLLVGDNGSGKTTLMEYYADQPKTRHGNVAYLPQFWPDEFVGRAPTIEEFFHYVVDTSLHACDGHNRNVAKNRFFQKLQGTPLHSKQRPFLELSGGEQRLTWFLAASSIPAIDILMSDEPTNHMDDRMRQVVTRSMIDFSSQGGGVLISTHDLDLMQELEANTAISLHLNVFTKEAGRTRIENIADGSIGERMRQRIAVAKSRGKRAV